MPEVSGTNPISDDKPDTNVSDSNVTQYVTYQVESTKHTFSAPKDKYKDIISVLGLKEDDGKGLRLQQGTGFIYLTVQTEGGASYKVACDPDKIKTALDGLPTKKIYTSATIKRARIPKRRLYI